MRKSIAEYSAQYPNLQFEKVVSRPKTFADCLKDGLCSALLPISSVSFQESIESVRKILHSMSEYPDNSTSRVERFVQQNPYFFRKTNNERTTKTMTTNESLSQKQAEAKKLQDQLATVESEINRLTEIQETECTVTMRPVCDCGHVFTDLQINAIIMSEHDSRSTPDINIPRFDPVCCPNCKKRIMSISNPAIRERTLCGDKNMFTFAKA